MKDLAVCLERIESAKCLQRLGAKSYLRSLHWGITNQYTAIKQRVGARGPCMKRFGFAIARDSSFNAKSGVCPLFFAGDDA